MLAKSDRLLNSVAFLRGPISVAILAALGISILMNAMCIASDSVAAKETAAALGLLRRVRDTHGENLSRIVTVEGEALMRLYTRTDLPSGEVHHVTETVSIRYAWDKPMQRRWSEYKVLDFLINGETAPADHPEWSTRRQMVDRERHISVATGRSGTIPSSGEYPVPVLTATISPLHGEVEAMMNRIEQGRDAALSYGLGDDFDIRFYFSNGGQDLQQLLSGRIGILEDDPDGYPGLVVRETEPGSRQIIEMRTEMAAGDEATMLFTTRFDPEQGGNPVYISTNYNDMPVWESSHEYHYLADADVWYPSSAHLRDWRCSGDRCVLTTEIRILFGLKTSVNRPWSKPNLFSLEGSGLREGDWVIDKLSGKAYRYEDYK